MHLYCPACGLLGHRTRQRRRRVVRVLAAGHIAWAAALARETRRQRAQRVFDVPWEMLLAPVPPDGSNTGEPTPAQMETWFRP